MDDLHKKIHEAKAQGIVGEKLYQIFIDFYDSYLREAKNTPREQLEAIFTILFEKVLSELKNPTPFQPYHHHIREPFDYYQFGVDFIRPVVDQKNSKIFNIKYVDQMTQQVAAGDNVILYANHQSEVDPQLISLLLEKTHPELGKEMIFVAGDRVISDPLAIPFSLGRNLLCIYSKRHIDNPPERKSEKQLHNQRTMKRMRELLSEGGKCIYVAPSGGRDRPNVDGKVTVAPFDPSNLEMFRLMAEQAKKPTHFYTLALSTYDLLPPPKTIEKELGEIRKVAYGPAFLSFGPELDMHHFPDADLQDRHARRIALARHVWNIVVEDYNQIKK